MSFLFKCFFHYVKTEPAYLILGHEYFATSRGKLKKKIPIGSVVGLWAPSKKHIFHPPLLTVVSELHVMDSPRSMVEGISLRASTSVLFTTSWSQHVSRENEGSEEIIASFNIVIAHDSSLP